MSTSENPSHSPVEWNIFASELQQIMQTHGYSSLWSLQNVAKVHSEKVHRLVRSLATPKSFPTLNASELTHVKQVFQFTPVEYQRLIAAILTTSIELALMNRVNRDLAYQATKSIFPILLEMVEQDAIQNGILTNLESETRMDEQLDMISAALSGSGIFTLIDRAALALYTSETTSSLDEAIDCGQQALADLQRAERLLTSLSQVIVTSDAGSYWQQEIQSEIALVTRRINDLTFRMDD